MRKITKKIILCLLCALLVVIPVTEICQARTVAAQTKGAEEKSTKVKKSKKKKILIVYYSQSGTTKKVAERIKKMTGADIYRIQTRKKYPTDYDELVELGEKELEEGVRPELKNKRKSVKKYDTIILGYPIWWGDAPMAVYTFLESYDLSGKNIVPFCTSGGSNISESMRHIRKVCKGASVKKGLTANEISNKRLKKWLEKSGVKVK